ncbi:U3 small nucleolar RNA-associated protein 25 homolog [Lineus longissimus]|uniref:U3 small nucleolar RNA-associated protein 25 homolog n=1 Tax=Lineus longissimus TaxID=88925 RepID=UPI00315CEF84
MTSIQDRKGKDLPDSDESDENDAEDEGEVEDEDLEDDDLIGEEAESDEEDEFGDDSEDDLEDGSEEDNESTDDEEPVRKKLKKDSSDAEPSQTGKTEDEDEGAASSGESDVENILLQEEEEVDLSTDPFHIHFEKEIPECLAVQLADGSKPWQKEEKKFSSVGKYLHLYSDEKYVSNFKDKERDVRKLDVKPKLCDHLKEVNRDCVAAPLKESGYFSPLQQDLFSVLNSYQDLYYPEQTYKNAEEIRLIYCLHALNHVLKTRSRVIAHSAKIKSKKDDIPDDYRDHGLTRPKVLIVVPFRDSALKIVNLFSSLLMKKEEAFVSNRKRFDDAYGEKDADDRKAGKKPDDYEAIFTGNIDDHFRIGIGVAKKTLKLFTEFYSSDIIITSPLGLRTIIGVEGEEKRDFDFLSSIELLIFDQTDIFLMQNWDHITQLMSCMHLQPKEAHGVDFSRVRMWTLNGWSKYYRQTLIFSSLVTPEINALFNKHSQNYAGKVMVMKPPTPGTICQIVTLLPQVFQRVHAESYSQLADARFQYFIQKVLPQYKDAVMSQTMVFIPSYFDYVRLRNYFKKEEMDAAFICEYTKDKSISRSRNHFFHGKVHFLLYTERIHFYRRYKIRGIRHIIFYELPAYPHFYSEICNMLIDAKKDESQENKTCSVIYSRYDAQRLSAVVGTERASYMVNAEKAVHMFVTGDS